MHEILRILSSGILELFVTMLKKETDPFFERGSADQTKYLKKPQLLHNYLCFNVLNVSLCQVQ